MIITLQVPSPISDALEQEAALSGLTPAAWLLDRLSDRFGLPHQPAPSFPLTNDTALDD